MDTWRRETLKEENDIVKEAITTMEGAGVSALLSQFYPKSNGTK